MGAIAEGLMAYAQPLIDETDGSIEQMNNAMGISQFCWNAAILPPEGRQSLLDSLGDVLSMDEAEVESFKRSVVLPMIRRHEEMFPRLHQRQSLAPPHAGPRLSSVSSTDSPQADTPKPGRYDPCPCGSGRKYKFCCGGRQ